MEGSESIGDSKSGVFRYSANRFVERWAVEGYYGIVLGSFLLCNHKATEKFSGITRSCYRATNFSPQTAILRAMMTTVQ